MSWLKANLSRMGMLLVIIIPGLLQLVIFGALIQLVLQAEVERKGVEHAKNVMVYVGEMARMADQLSTSFLTKMSGTDDENDIARAKRERIGMIEEVRENLQRLKKLSDTSGSAQGRKLLKEITAIAEENLENVKKVQILSEGSGYSYQMRECLRKARALNVKLHSALDRISSLDYQSQTAAVSDNKQVIWLAVALGCNFIFTVIAAGFYSRQIARRLARVSENSSRMASNLPLLPVLTGSDEIARLDQVLHSSTAALAELNRKERALAENVNDVICSLDEQMRFLAVNAAVSKEWGLTQEELLGYSLFDVVADEDRLAVAQEIATIKAVAGARVFEARVWRDDGSTGHYLWSVTHAQDDNAFFCVAHDITDSKELEQLRQRFLAMVSHDLRSPLTSILALLNVVTAGGCGNLSPSAGEQLRQAEKNMVTLIGLINDLLDVERLNADKMPMNPDRIMLAPLIEKSIELVLDLAETYEVEIDAEGTLAQVFADQERLKQVMVNLLSHAINNSAQGGLVSVKVDADENSVKILVSHEGAAPDKADTDTIFDLYRQGTQDSSKTRSSGIGLAICKAIVEKHGGSIGVEVESANQRTVWFSIPAREGLKNVD